MHRSSIILFTLICLLAAAIPSFAAVSVLTTQITHCGAGVASATTTATTVLDCTGGCTWTSSNTDVLTVTGSGGNTKTASVVGIKRGTAKVTAKNGTSAVDVSPDITVIYSIAKSIDKPADATVDAGKLFSAAVTVKDCKGEYSEATDPNYFMDTNYPNNPGFVNVTQTVYWVNDSNPAQTGSMVFSAYLCSSLSWGADCDDNGDGKPDGGKCTCYHGFVQDDKGKFTYQMRAYRYLASVNIGGVEVGCARCNVSKIENVFFVPGISPAVSSSKLTITVKPLAPTVKSFNVSAPSTSPAKAAFSTEITAIDEEGFALKSYKSDVKITVTSTSGTTGFKVSFSGGGCSAVAGSNTDAKCTGASFTNGRITPSISINKPGRYKIDVASTSGTAASGLDGITITSVPEKLQLSVPVFVYKEIPYTATVYVLDGADHPASGFTGSVTLTLKGSASGSATITCPGKSPAGSCDCKTDAGGASCSARVEPMMAGTLTVNATATFNGNPLQSDEKSTTIKEAWCKVLDILPPSSTVSDRNITVGVETIDSKGLVTSIDTTNDGAAVATALIDGSEKWCTYGSTSKKVKLCVGSDGGMFNESGLLCVHALVYSPQVDGEISDHFGFYSNDLSRENLASTANLYYPHLIWSYGYRGYDKDATIDLCSGSSGYKVKLGAPSITVKYFNLSVMLTGNVSLPPYDIWSDPANRNPHVIKGVNAIYALQKTPTSGNSAQLFRFNIGGGTVQESYPATSPPDFVFSDSNALAVDRKGNLYVADSMNARIVVFKTANSKPPTPMTQKVGQIPADGGLLKVGSTAYFPLGMAFDSWNKIYIVGFTSFDDGNHLVIDVRDTTPDFPSRATYISTDALGTLVTGAGGKSFERNTANIGVDSRGLNVYVGTSDGKIRTFQMNGGTLDVTGTMDIFIPCRHVGPGCWAGGCRRLYTHNDWLNYDNDKCSMSSDGDFELGSSGGCNPGDSLAQKSDITYQDADHGIWGISNSGKFSTSSICHQIDTLDNAVHDGPYGDTGVSHQVQALFYKRGYVFIVDKMTYTRDEGYGDGHDCSIYVCGAGACTDCWFWAPSIKMCSGWGGIPYPCGGQVVEYYSYESVYSDQHGNCNYCGGENSHVRNEYWLRVYYEDDAGGLQPIYHGAFNKAVGGVFFGKKYNYEGPALWGGDTSRYPEAGVDDGDYYGRLWTAAPGFGGGGGTSDLLEIANDGVTDATGLFVDDAYNVYIAVEGSASVRGIYKLSMTLTGTSASKNGNAALISGTSTLTDISAVAVYPDLINATASLGVYCEGCSDKAGLSMDVCQQEQSKAAAREGAPDPTLTTMKFKDIKEQHTQIWIDSVINGAVDVSYNSATITPCGTGTASGRITASATAQSNHLNATVEGGMFTVVFTRPYRQVKSSPPQGLPTLTYEVYSSRYLFKHFVVFDQIKGTSKHPTNTGAVPFLVNSTYRFNFQRWKNEFYGYQYATTNIDMYNNVPSTVTTNFRYDKDAAIGPPVLMPEAGYTNMSLKWGISEDYPFSWVKVIPNPLPFVPGGGSGTFNICSCNKTTPMQCSDLSKPSSLLEFTIYGEYTDPGGCTAGAGFLTCTTTNPCFQTTWTSAGTWKNITRVMVRNKGSIDATGGLVAAGDTHCTTGCLWFDTTNGLASYNPAKPKEIHYPYLVPGAVSETPTGPTLDIPPDMQAEWRPLGVDGVRLYVKPVNVTGDTGLTIIGVNATGDSILGSAQVVGTDLPNYIGGSAGDVQITAVRKTNVQITFQGTNETGGFTTNSNETVISAGSTFTVAGGYFTPRHIINLSGIMIGTNDTVTVTVRKNVAKPGEYLKVPTSPYYVTLGGSKYGFTFGPPGAFITDDPPTHYVPDSDYFPIIAQDPLNSLFVNITSVSGSGAHFGDLFEVYNDSKVILPIQEILIPEGNGATNISAPMSMFIALESYPSLLNVSAHKYLCCNHTNRSYDYKMEDQCGVDAATAISTCNSTGDKDSRGNGGACSGNVEIDLTKCSTPLLSYYCNCQYRELANETYINTYPFEDFASCSFCNRTGTDHPSDCYEDLDADGDVTNNNVARSDNLDSTCDTTGYYKLGGSQATVRLLGLNTAYQRSSWRVTLNDAVTAADTGYAMQPEGSSTGPLLAVFKIIVTNGADFTLNITNATGSEILTVPVMNNSYSKENALARLDPPEPRTLRIVTDLKAPLRSTVSMHFLGVDASDNLVEDTISLGGGTTEASGTTAFAAIYRIEVTGGTGGEMINLTTSSKNTGMTDALVGTVRVGPKKFAPTAYQNASGTFLYSNKDSIAFQIVDNNSLGMHNINWTFYDRFANAFIWDQPFNFTLPTKIVLVPIAERDQFDPNMTRITVMAQLYFSRIDQPDMEPSNPLPNHVLTFWEWNVTRGEAAPNFVLERNYIAAAGSSTPCSCDIATCCATGGYAPCGSGVASYQCFKCYTSTNAGVNQKSCSFNSQCSGTGGTCRKMTFCTNSMDCGGGGSCVDSADYPGFKVCALSGRCLHNYGYVGTNTTCNTEAGCEGGNVAYGETKINYTVCGWGRHRLVALFDPPAGSVYSRALAIAPYYSGGFPLDIGGISLIAPIALILILIAAKLLWDRRGRKTAPSGARA